MSATAALTTRPTNGANPPTDLVMRNTLIPAPPLSNLVPKDVTEVAEYAKMFARSGMFAAKTVEAAFTIILTGMELGLGPAQSMRAFHIIEGKPSPSADAKVALCLRRSDICKYFTCISSSDTEATFETWRIGAPAPVSATYTLEDARRAGLLNKDNWKRHQPLMIIARAKSKLTNIVYADLMLGLYTPEELNDPDFMEMNLVGAPLMIGETLSPQAVEAAGLEKAQSLRQAIKAVVASAKANDPELHSRLQGKYREMLGTAKLSEVEEERLEETLAALVELTMPSEEPVIEAEFAAEEAHRAGEAENDSAVAGAELDADMKAKLEEEGDPFED